ncbi:MAG: thioredoxin domain-containing protein [Bacillota bacterium]
MANRLAREKSLYLLQHADNPVDWYAWTGEAFEKAKNEDRPVFLSIGYSTCHWCHVMERESFEDEEVARLMNEVFVNVKVDREERPDIDSTYMTVCQVMTGSGGWPLTVIMTPDKKPFFAATYIPKESRFGRLGMMELVPQIKRLWETRRDEIESKAGQVVSVVKDLARGAAGEEIGEASLKAAFEQLLRAFDREHGGFGTAPKFPMPHNLTFLLRYWKRSGDARALEMVEKTLQAMRSGGIYDHLGFGFHRYSTDARWLLPHFEKMLYDQALLAIAYLEAYQATGNRLYARTAQEIFAYVMRDMTDPGGGFYSAEDADSEGKEGEFYLWAEEEIRQLLSDNEAALALKVFNIKAGGNFREATGGLTGKNVLFLHEPTGDAATGTPMAEKELREELEVVREKLFRFREKRVHPHKDDKILADWNGLMIAAMAKGAQVFDDPGYAAAAARAADFVLKVMRDERGTLYHRCRDGETAVPAFLDDYSFMIWGLIELYEATFEVRYLQAALELNDTLLKRFRDDKDGGFYFTSDAAEDVLVRRKEIYDGAVPSGNSVAMLNLLRLGLITADPALEQKASLLGRAFSGSVLEAPSAHTQLMAAVDFAIGPSYEIVIVGRPQAQDTQKMLSAVRSKFIPNKVVMARLEGEETAQIGDIAGFVSGFSSQEGRATAYVCLDHNCRLPTTDTSKVLELLMA